MHDAKINPVIEQRITRRRGRFHPFDGLAARRTALIVVDLQNGFLIPGAAAEVPMAREIIPNVNRISGALRKAGGLVVYIQNTCDEQAVASWPTYYEHFCSPAHRQRMIDAFTPGSMFHDVFPGLDVQPQDLKVMKRRFGCFLNSSDLDDILRSRGIDTVIITGTATNACCETTAREANALDYKVFFVSDGTATHSDSEHAAALSAVANIFGDVVSTDEVISLIEADAG